MTDVRYLRSDVVDALVAAAVAAERERCAKIAEPKRGPRAKDRGKYATPGPSQTAMAVFQEKTRIAAAIRKWEDQ